MDFKASYVREQKRYTKTDLQKLFEFTPTENEGFIRLLKAYGILKSVKKNPNQTDMTELVDADLEYIDVTAEDGACYYVFTYVGVIIVGNRVIKCYPKYLSPTEEPVNEMRQIIRVLQKYASKEQVVNFFNVSEQYIRSLYDMRLRAFRQKSHDRMGRTFFAADHARRYENKPSCILERTAHGGFHTAAYSRYRVWLNTFAFQPATFFETPCGIVAGSGAVIHTVPPDNSIG